MEALGLSMALGTFIAGILLAESEYRHELEMAIDPFKGLLLGLFFISVGMVLNLGVFYTHALWVLISVAVKTLILYVLAWLCGLRSANAVCGCAQSGGRVCLRALFYSVITEALSGRSDGLVNGNGYAVNEGRRQVVDRLLMANTMRITVLERDISVVNLMRKYGYKVYYGDATQVELLRSAGAESAKSIVITCNAPEDIMKIVHLCQQYFPHLNIMARARGHVEAHELLQAGVTQFSRETFSSALELGRKVLMSLGMHPHQAQRALEEIFQREMQQERQQYDGWDDFE